MAFCTHRPPPPRGRVLSPTFRHLLLSFLLEETLPLGDALREADLLAAFAQEQVTFAQDDPDAVYTPAVTLWPRPRPTKASG
jgi:hypothetical protein